MIHGPLISRGTSGADLAGGGGEREAGRLVRCLISKIRSKRPTSRLKLHLKPIQAPGQGGRASARIRNRIILGSRLWLSGPPKTPPKAVLEPPGRSRSAFSIDSPLVLF